MDLTFELYKIKTGDLMERVNDHMYSNIMAAFANVYQTAYDISMKNHHPEQIIPSFRKLLKEVAQWNQKGIIIETKKIVNGCPGIDKMILAIIKTDIMTISYPIPCDKYIDEVFRKFNMEKFVHECYIQCAYDFYSSPQIFAHNEGKLPLSNQLAIKNNIFSCIQKTIRNMVDNVDLLLEPWLSMPTSAIYGGKNKTITPKKSEKYKELSQYIIPSREEFRGGDYNSTNKGYISPIKKDYNSPNKGYISPNKRDYNSTNKDNELKQKSDNIVRVKVSKEQNNGYIEEYGGSTEVSNK